MRTQIRITLLTAFLFFGIPKGSYAQVQYEYSTVTYNMQYKEIGISENGTEFILIKVSKEDFVSVYDTNPALKEVKKLTDKGWELFDTDGGIGVYVFFLRKKIG